MNKTLLFLSILLTYNITCSQVHPNNEDSQHQELLTSENYNTANGGLFRAEGNKFVYFASQIHFQHPVANSNRSIPNLFNTRVFGSVNDQSGSTQYHNAKDMKAKATNDRTLALFA